MNVVITNISAVPVAIGDLYTTIPVGGSVTTKRSASQLSAMVSLQKAVEANTVTVAATEESFETASGLAVAPGTVAAADVQPVAATDVAAATFEIRKSFVGAAAGTDDDVTIYAAGALPFKMRILDAYFLCSTGGSGAKTLTIRDEAAGAGTAAAAFDTTSTGRIAPTAFTATTVFTPGAAKGLFLRRIQRDAAGEVVITARRET